jgi:MSHA biogenesis protein MshG
MPTTYKYEAASADGTVHKGTLAAESSSRVVEYLTEKKLTPILVKQEKERKSFSLLGFFGSSDYESLIMFTNTLATMYRAGVPILRALSVIKVGDKSGRFNAAIERIRLDVQSGKSLSSAMAESDPIFSRVYTSSIAAGEESGHLEEILDELSSMLEKELELTRLIKAALRYPIMVISAIFAATAILMLYVIPRFVNFYSAFNAELPLPTRIIIGMSQTAMHYWWVPLLLAAGLVFALKKTLANENGKLWIDEKLLKLPVFGPLIIKGNVARFSMMFTILFKSGIPIVRSLEILVDSIRNSVLAREVAELRELFQQGRDTILESPAIKYFPQLALQMLSIGLESGSVDRMLKATGDHFHKQVQYTSRNLSAILEPVLTAVLGAFVLLLALGIFLPMWNLMQVFRSM